MIPKQKESAFEDTLFVFLSVVSVRSALGLEVVVDLFYQCIAVHAVNHASFFNGLS